MLANALLEQFVGGHHTLHYAGRDVTLTVRRVAAAISPAALAAGHLGRVQVTATDVRWSGRWLDRVTLTADEVQLRPARAPAVMLTARSIRIEVALAAERLSSWLPARRLIDARIGPDGVLRAVLRGAPRMGGVELEPHVAEATIRLCPRAVRIGRTLRVPLRLPAYRIRLPHLPYRLQLNGIEPVPAAIILSGWIPRWEGTLSLTALAGGLSAR
jgi:hypothetical protein